MKKRLIFTLATILPNLLFAATENNSFILKIESASDSEQFLAKKILSLSTDNSIIIESSSKNITVKINESQEQIDDLILQLKNGLGNSVNIEKLPVTIMKKGSQDDIIGW